MTTITNTFDKLKEIEEVISLFHDDMTLMFGGFGGIGSPPSLIQAILEKGVTNLNLIGNDTGFPDVGIGRLVTNERVKSLITSHIGSNPNAGRQLNEGRLQIEFSPQGTLAERIRAGGVGLGGVLVDVGVDTIVEEGKRTVEMNGKTYLVETALTAEVAIVYAKKADPFGNLVFDKSARNMNPHVAMAGDIT
ncbi:CoA transferase subunit A, partial [Bacillus anthracis]